MHFFTATGYGVSRVVGGVGIAVFDRGRSGEGLTAAYAVRRPFLERPVASRSGKRFCGKDFRKSGVGLNA